MPNERFDEYGNYGENNPPAGVTTSQLDRFEDGVHRELVKEVNTKYYAEYDTAGNRCIRVVKEILTYFPRSSETRHNPSKSKSVEYL